MIPCCFVKVFVVNRPGFLAIGRHLAAAVPLQTKVLRPGPRHHSSLSSLSPGNQPEGKTNKENPILLLLFHDEELDSRRQEENFSISIEV